MSKQNSHACEPTCTNRYDALHPSPQPNPHARQKNGASDGGRRQETIEKVYHRVSDAKSIAKLQRTDPNRESNFKSNANKNKQRRYRHNRSEKWPSRQYPEGEQTEDCARIECNRKREYETKE